VLLVGMLFAYMTGGAFGPEGGFLATLVISAGFYMVWRFSGGGDPWRTREPEGGADSGLPQVAPKE
jgi:hypothetical protein